MTGDRSQWNNKLRKCQVDSHLPDQRVSCSQSLPRCCSSTGSSIHLAHQNKSIRDDQIEIVFINSIKGFGQDLMNRRPVNHCSPFQNYIIKTKLQKIDSKYDSDFNTSLLYEFAYISAIRLRQLLHRQIIT